MPDFQGIIKNISAVLQLIFGKNVPNWITLLVGWALLISIFLCAIWGFLAVVSKIKDLWTQSFKSIFYKPDQKRLCRKRQMIAKHIEYEIIRLDLLEDWKDKRFTELEAEVEAEGKRRAFSIIPFFNRIKDGTRREKSLSKALASSQARCILVEGEPGSGKSVALRHVAQKMAASAQKSRNLQSIIPIYINLKELERTENEEIDRNLIESFVKKTLTRSNDRDVEQFLDEHFTTGIEEGTWFFLFDSFDEIPEILSSTEVDTIIRRYGDALADFLSAGLNMCRGIIASRQFRGPKQFGWPHFRIVALTEDRQLELIRKMDFDRKIQNEFVGQLDTAAKEIRSMASNPLFLALLCEHVKSGHAFPKNVHSVFETYVETRLKRDELRIQKRFKLDLAEVRTGAENIAFCMASDTGIGLSPSRVAIRKSLAHLSIDIPADLDTLLDVLEYTKLGRPGGGIDIGQPKSFTFAHRRFQEYFATCVVLNNPHRVSAIQLLTDARWRETTVAMFQTQPVSTLGPILEQAESLMFSYCSDTSDLIEEPFEYVKHHATSLARSGFPWPARSLHLLNLLQDGFSSHPENVSSFLRTSIDKIILTATETGRLDDRKWALEVSGTLSNPIQEYVLEKAFASESQWLKETAYRQISQLKDIPSKIADGIFRTLVNLAMTGRLRKEKYANRVYLGRLQQSEKFLPTLDFLLRLPFIVFFWSLLLICDIILNLTQYLTAHKSNLILFLLIILPLLFPIYYIYKSLPRKIIYIGGNENLIKVLIFVVELIGINALILFFQYRLFVEMLLILECLGLYPIALWSATVGFLNYWIPWAFLPFYPIIWMILYSRVIQKIPVLISNINKVNITKRSLKDTIESLATILLILILLAAFIFLVIKFSFITGLIFGVIFGLTIIITIALNLKNIFDLFICQKIIFPLQDVWLWHNMEAMLRKSQLMNCQEFWKTLKKYHGITYRIKVIRAVREQQKLEISEETEIFLSEIAWEAEKYLGKFFRSRTEKSEDISWINATVVDELYILLNEVRVLRQGSE